MLMRILLLLGCVLLLAACGPSIRGEGEGDAVTLRAEPSTAAPGDTVELILTNQSGGTLGYNLCSSGMEQRAGASWTSVPSNRMCTMELRMLPPGESARFPLGLESGLSAGEYRFVTTVHDEAAGSSTQVRSGVVRVSG
jgi:hypothetical protein